MDQAQRVDDQQSNLGIATMVSYVHDIVAILSVYYPWQAAAQGKRLLLLSGTSRRALIRSLLNVLLQQLICADCLVSNLQAGGCCCRARRCRTT